MTAADLGAAGGVLGGAAELRAKACQLTGLDDFGVDDFSDGLSVLLDSLHREAGLTAAGARAARAIVRGGLTARLVSEAGFASFPALGDVPVRRPVFVTGLPRTGTTFLHRLLVADPSAQGLELWLAEAPKPRPSRALWASDPVYQFVAAGLARHREARPSFSDVHEMGPGQVEECWQLLRQSMRSVSFECLAHLPWYSAWLSEISWVPAYQRHKRNLQLIGFQDRDKRWVLKNPSHIFALDALLRVYPDALVVVTHRDPAVALASMCSLAAQASDGWSEVFRGSVIGRSQLDLWSRGYSAFAAARSRHPAEQFLDVPYDDLVSDPLSVVSRVYQRLGVPLSDAAAAAMRALIPSPSGSGKPSGHRYTLADFGLTAALVSDAFRGAGA